MQQDILTLWNRLFLNVPAQIATLSYIIHNIFWVSRRISSIDVNRTNGMNVVIWVWMDYMIFRKNQLVFGKS